MAYLAKLEHKGFTILLDSSGQFKVSDRPDLPMCESMKLVKEQIDISLKRERKPISALMFGGPRYDRSSQGIVEVTVTSTQKSKWSPRGDAWVRTKSGGRSKESCADVFLDTPANRDLMRECVTLTAEAKAIDDKIEKLKQRLSTVPVEGGTG